MQLAHTVSTELASRLHRLHRFQIRVEHGRDTGCVAVAEGRELSVGTAPGNHLVLTDPTVSRQHLVVRASERGYWVSDLGSTNGIMMGSHFVQVAAVSHGSELSIGTTRIVFELLDDEICEPMAVDQAWGTLLGASSAMRRLFAMVPRISQSCASVLIEGETGTGKTALAHALHAASSRAHRPFVVVDCSSIPPTQIESVLFGLDEAAFTGAHAARPGAFEAAHGGTVFLDEIGELPLELQPKLLRLLESHQVQRIGAAAPSSLDVRIIAATNRDLRDMVSRGTCRADLYYRLAVVTLQIPPLRARREDIPGLVAHFYRELGQSKRPSEALLCELSRLDWPGNVRELRSAVERAVLLGELSVDDILDRKEAALAELTSGDPERRATFTDEFEPQLTFRDAKERATALWERWYVAQLLRHTHGNLSEAARVAHSDRGYLRKLLRKHSP